MTIIIITILINKSCTSLYDTTTSQTIHNDNRDEDENDEFLIFDYSFEKKITNTEKR